MMNNWDLYWAIVPPFRDEVDDTLFEKDCGTWSFAVERLQEEAPVGKASFDSFHWLEEPDHPHLRKFLARDLESSP